MDLFAVYNFLQQVNFVFQRMPMHMKFPLVLHKRNRL